MIDAVAEAGKPLVGHNCLLDLAHVVSKFRRGGLAPQLAPVLRRPAAAGRGRPGAGVASDKGDFALKLTMNKIKHILFGGGQFFFFLIIIRG